MDLQHFTAVIDPNRDQRQKSDIQAEARDKQISQGIGIEKNQNEQTEQSKHKDRNRKYQKIRLHCREFGIVFMLHAITCFVELLPFRLVGDSA